MIRDARQECLMTTRQVIERFERHQRLLEHDQTNSCTCRFLEKKSFFFQIIVHHAQKSRIVIEIENEPAMPATFESK